MMNFLSNGANLINFTSLKDMKYFKDAIKDDDDVIIIDREPLRIKSLSTDVLFINNIIKKNTGGYRAAVVDLSFYTMDDALKLVNSIILEYYNTALTTHIGQLMIVTLMDKETMPLFIDQLDNQAKYILSTIATIKGDHIHFYKSRNFSLTEDEFNLTINYDVAKKLDEVEKDENKQFIANNENDIPLNKVTMAVGDMRMFEALNVTHYNNDNKSIIMSACNVCLKCNAIYNRDDVIQISVPNNIPFYNIHIDADAWRCGLHPVSHKEFPCDPLIADSVLNFNLKGYKTFCSCSGHVRYRRESYSPEKYIYSISPTYIIFKNLTNKQKNNLITTIINHFNFSNEVYFFEYDCNNVKDYYYGNNLSIMIDPCLDSYDNTKCYRLSHNKFLSLHNRYDIDVADEDEGNKRIDGYCKLMELLSSSVPEYKEKKLKYDVL